MRNRPLLRGLLALSSPLLILMSLLVLLQRRGDRNRQFRHDGFLFFRTTREEQRKQSEQ